jgi:hypothetical protein
VFIFFLPFIGNILAFLQSVMAIGLIIAGLLLYYWNDIQALVSEIIANLGDIVFPASGPTTSGFSYYYTLANTFTPISETVTLAVGYLALLVGLNIYRFIKSWIRP